MKIYHINIYTIILIITNLGCSTQSNNNNLVENFSKDLAKFIKSDLSILLFRCNDEFSELAQITLNKSCFNNISIWDYNTMFCNAIFPELDYQLFEAGESFIYFESLDSCINLDLDGIEYELDSIFVNSNDFNKVYITLNSLYESDERYWIEVVFTNKYFATNYKVLFVYDKDTQVLRHIMRNLEEQGSTLYEVSYDGKYNFVAALNEKLESAIAKSLEDSLKIENQEIDELDLPVPLNFDGSFDIYPPLDSN